MLDKQQSESTSRILIGFMMGVIGGIILEMTFDFFRNDQDQPWLRRSFWKKNKDYEYESLRIRLMMKRKI
jgi:hypothetical protein